MKKWLQTLAERIDGMVLRERVLLFVATLACVLAVVDTWWLAPTQEEQKRLSANLRREDADMEQLRVQLRVLGDGRGAGMDQNDVRSLKETAQQLRRELDAMQADSKTVNGLSQVLVQFLRQQDGLQLVRVATLPDEPVAARPQTAASGAAAPSTPVLRSHRVELAVSGPYLELARYLRTLEQALPKLHWGRMKLTSESAGVATVVMQVSYLEVTP